MFFESRLFYVHNIPPSYRARDLRNFFSRYIESEKFHCFHFRHRPSLIFPQKKDDLATIDASEIISAVKLHSRKKDTRCAFVSLSKQEAMCFSSDYSGLHWLEPFTDVPMSECCLISCIQNFAPGEYEGNTFMRPIGLDFKSFIEFKPPKCMPRGNVGTPSSYFFNLIKTCQLESSIISKLKLDFSRFQKDRRYGAVPYNYDTGSTSEYYSPYLTLKSSKGVTLLNEDEFTDFSEIYGLSKERVSELSGAIKESEIQHSGDDHDDDDDKDEKELENEEDDDDAEEWDRFEALHDDPYHVNRSDKANIKYENKVELVWEKGGSGLVFHTDERTWRKMDPLRKEEFFDEPASFDWDIDMEPYDNPTRVGPGPTPTGNWGLDRDTADLIDINRSREHIDAANLYHDPKALFAHEVHKKGFGTAILERMGWKPGMRLGPSTTQSGLLEPLTAEGSLAAKTRPGLGYYGPRRSKVPPLTRTISKQVYIRTVFDSPQTVHSRCLTGSSPSLLRRADSDLGMKWLPKPVEKSTETCSTMATTSNVTYIPKNRTVIISPYTKLSKEGIHFVSGGMLNPGSR